jgi:hypothetical protein
MFHATSRSRGHVLFADEGTMFTSNLVRSSHVKLPDDSYRRLQLFMPSGCLEVGLCVQAYSEHSHTSVGTTAVLLAPPHHGLPALAYIPYMEQDKSTAQRTAVHMCRAPVPSQSDLHVCLRAWCISSSSELQPCGRLHRREPLTLLREAVHCIGTTCNPIATAGEHRSNSDHVLQGVRASSVNANPS